MPDPIADELAIRNLIARLARNADVADIDTYMSSFAPDAEWNMPGSPARGHDAILSGLLARRESGAVGPGTRTRHTVSTISVVVDGDRAEGVAYFQFFTDTDTQPTLRLMGAYRDAFTRTPDGWRLARRDITFG
jgi:uncharacterized protein (TIGR02246 family)